MAVKKSASSIDLYKEPEDGGAFDQPPPRHMPQRRATQTRFTSTPNSPTKAFRRAHEPPTDVDFYFEDSGMNNHYKLTHQVIIMSSRYKLCRMQCNVKLMAVFPLLQPGGSTCVQCMPWNTTRIDFTNFTILYM